MGALSNRAPWYGADLAWRIPLENAAKRRYGRHLSFELSGGRLDYRLDQLEVTGRTEPVPVRISFFQRPYYSCGPLSPEDYPRVFADRGAASKHRMPGDDALCLYAIDDPEERRWRSRDGLLTLLDITADHLFAEEHWRTTTVWPLPEAPHGRFQ